MNARPFPAAFPTLESARKIAANVDVISPFVNHRAQLGDSGRGSAKHGKKQKSPRQELSFESRLLSAVLAKVSSQIPLL